jgi:serine/threonine protein kinase/Flp pilus assembly protein TadD
MNPHETVPPPVAEPGTSSEVELAQALDAYMAAVEAGRSPDPEQLLAEHPAVADRLRACLASLRLVERAAGSLAGAAADGGDGDAGRPEVLGDFRIIREVGRGGMGVVYEAEQVSLGRRVALKVLPLAATMDARQLQRFHNEARAAAGLHHTNIVPVFGVGCERGVHYYAMQFIDGRTLADVIAQQRREDVQQLPTTPAAEAAASATTAPPAAQATSTSPRDATYFRRAAEWGIQAAEALDCAHQLGVVHRDVKPGNLLVDAGGRLWVTDFGLAQVQSDARLTLTGDLVGTLRYMSPEQALAKRVVIDHRTDVYSLGATLYELLTLQPAYSGNDRQELLRQIAFEEPRALRRINRAIPAELQTIVLKALEKNPAERYGTAQELADDLRRWLDDRPIQARRPSWGRRVAKWTRRHRAAVRAAAAVFLLATVLCGALALWWLQKRAVAQADAKTAVGEAVGYQQDERWPEALSAARRAQGVLAGVWADPILRQQANQLAEDMEMAQKLEDARLRRAALGGGLDNKSSDLAYAEAFRWYNLDPERLDPHDAAVRIRSRSIRDQLVAAVDDWAYVRRARGVEGWTQLLAVSRAADSDPWRDRMRDAIERKDPGTLEQLAGFSPSDELAPATAVLVGRLTVGTPAAERAVVVLRQVRQRHPDDFWINEELGLCLAQLRPAQLEEAVRYLTAAAALRPRSPTTHANLGAALRKMGHLDEAILECREAVRLKMDEALAHINLGNALADKSQLDEAVGEYQQALQFNKNLPAAHSNLGVALDSKGQLDQAIAEYREALRLEPNYAEAHNNLGYTLVKKHELAGAIREYRQAIELQEDFAIAHKNLGDALQDTGRFDEAIAEYRKALRHQNNYAAARNNLGAALVARGQLDEAITELREAIQLKNDDPLAHNNLGDALLAKSQLEEAVSECRKAVQLQPDFALGHCNLGRALLAKGQFRQAVEELRLAHELGARDPRWRYPTGQLIRQAEQMAQVDDRLPGVLLGKDRPSDSAEGIAFAKLCQFYRKQYAAAACFYNEAFAGQPALAEKLGEPGSRYDAACAAALAGCGQGKDADECDDKERARLRRQALNWLRADLAAWQKLLEKEPDRASAAAAPQLAHWLEDTDFAGVRGEQALAKLPEAERRDWQQLWNDVAGTLARAQGKPAPMKQPDRQ